MERSRTVVVLVGDAMLRDRIRMTLHSCCAVQLARDAAHCAELMQQGSVRCLVVLLEEQLADRLRDLLRAIRAVPSAGRVIGLAGANQATAGLLLKAARDGIDDVVFRGDREMTALRASVLRSFDDDRPSTDRLLCKVVTDVPALLQPLLRQCVPRVTAAGGVAALASALRWHRNTLARRLARAGGPTPERFRAWCLLLRIGDLLDETALSIEQVGWRLNFSSSSALRHLVSRYVRATPARLRAAGAVRVVMEHFLAECEQTGGSTGRVHATSDAAEGPTKPLCVASPLVH